MLNDKYEKINYEIYPLKSLGAYLGLIASILGIGTVIYLLDGFWTVISIMGLIIVILLFFLVKVFLRLRTVKNNYNKIVDKINHADDNRETLVNMVEEKNKELESLKIRFHATSSLMNFFIAMVYSNGELPDRKIVESTFEIESKGVKEYEER